MPFISDTFQVIRPGISFGRWNCDHQGDGEARMSSHDVDVKSTGNYVESTRAGRPEQQAFSNVGWHAELLALWKKFLKSEDVSMDDDFFERGGDSYLAIELHMEVERLIGQKLPESTVFEAPTVRLLAERLSEQSK
jgi:acyl carrier protein